MAVPGSGGEAGAEEKAARDVVPREEEGHCQAEGAGDEECCREDRSLSEDPVPVRICLERVLT